MFLQSVISILLVNTLTFFAVSELLLQCSRNISLLGVLASSFCHTIPDMDQIDAIDDAPDSVYYSNIRGHMGTQ